MFTCWPVTHLRRSTLLPKCFLHTTTSKCWPATCHTSQNIDTLTRTFPTRQCLETLSYQPVKHPRRSTLWLECFLHFSVSNCGPVDLSHMSKEGPPFVQNVSYTYLPHSVNLSTCHTPEGRHFEQNISCTSLPQNVDLSACHTSRRSTLDQNVSYTYVLQNVDLLIGHTPQKINNVSCTSQPQLSTCRPVTQPRRSTLWPEVFLHFTASKCQLIDLSLLQEGRHFDQNVCYTFDLYLHWTGATEYINCIHTPEIFHFHGGGGGILK